MGEELTRRCSGLPKSASVHYGARHGDGSGHVAPMGGRSRAKAGIMEPSRRGRDRATTLSARGFVRQPLRPAGWCTAVDVPSCSGSCNEEESPAVLGALGKVLAGPFYAVAVNHVKCRISCGHGVRLWYVRRGMVTIAEPQGFCADRLGAEKGK